MAIYRRVKNKDNPYVMIHKHMIDNDNNLSWKAKGILLYLLSKPDDWQIIEKDIVNHAKDSRDSVRSGLAELIKAGYIVRSGDRNRNSKGQLADYDYDVYEVPSKDGKSNVGKTNIGKSNILLSNDYTNNNLNNNYKTLNTSASRRHEDFFYTVIDYYYEVYRSHKHSDHPRLKREYTSRAIQQIETYTEDKHLDYEAWQYIIDSFFDSNIQTDYNILHFLTDGMLEILCERQRVSIGSY
jgi:hypothetical protein